MERDTLPPYTPSSPSPRYSSGPSPGEQTVEFTRHGSSRPPAGVYRRITDSLTVVLRHQRPGSVYPVYGRDAIIQGDVILNSTSDLTSVILKLEGQLLLHISQVPVSVTFFSTTHTLWSATHAQCCPRIIPFGVSFPRIFDDGGQARALPPTFENSEPFAACSYSLTVELIRPRQFLSFLKSNEAVTIPFTYHPRNRPQLPMLPADLPFMSTVKSSPEEWHEVMCTIPTSQGSGLAPLKCLLFIPSVQTYAFSDTISFHLQICGIPAPLVPFLEQGQEGPEGQPDGGVVIRVYLLRRFNIRIYGRSTTVSRNVGEGEMKPSQFLSSRHHTFLRHSLSGCLHSLDWDGVLKCSEDVIVPSFSINQVAVKDSIALSITPRQPLKSPLLSVTHYSPIWLATDSWSNS